MGCLQILLNLFSATIVWLFAIQLDAWQCGYIAFWRRLHLAFHVDAGTLLRDQNPNMEPNFIPNPRMECVVLDLLAGQGCATGYADAKHVAS